MFNNISSTYITLIIKFLLMEHENDIYIYIYILFYDNYLLL